MTRDRSHLDALQLRLSHERARYAADKNELRLVWISQIEREIAAEIGDDDQNMTDDELLAALGL